MLNYAEDNLKEYPFNYFFDRESESTESEASSAIHEQYELEYDSDSCESSSSEEEETIPIPSEEKLDVLTEEETSEVLTVEIQKNS